jgi:hypothetical protein
LAIAGSLDFHSPVYRLIVVILLAGDHFLFFYSRIGVPESLAFLLMFLAILLWIKSPDTPWLMFFSGLVVSLVFINKIASIIWVGAFWVSAAITEIGREEGVSWYRLGWLGLGTVSGFGLWAMTVILPNYQNWVYLNLTSQALRRLPPDPIALAQRFLTYMPGSVYLIRQRPIFYLLILISLLSASLRLIRERAVARFERELLILFSVVFFGSGILNPVVRRLVYYIPVSYLFVTLALFGQREMGDRSDHGVRHSFYRIIGIAIFCVTVFSFCQAALALTGIVDTRAAIVSAGTALLGSSIAAFQPERSLIPQFKSLGVMRDWLEHLPIESVTIFAAILLSAATLLRSLSYVIPGIVRPTYTIRSAMTELESDIPESSVVYGPVVPADLHRRVIFSADYVNDIANRNPEYILTLLYDEDQYYFKQLIEERDYQLVSSYPVTYPIGPDSWDSKEYRLYVGN